jgi:hypothetical protein
MVGRRWPGISRALVRVRWPLAGLAALVVILACVLVVPQWLVRWELGAPARTLSPSDEAKAINDVRTTLLQVIAGALLILGAYFTYRQLQTSRDQLLIAQQGQVTERFTRAIDQLGHAEPAVRLGGIYALERIANDSPDDRDTIAEVLMAYVRGHAPWPPRLPGQYLADAPIEQVHELQVRAPDVQAALTVLGRRQPPPRTSGLVDPHGDMRRHLDLHATDLRKADLRLANLRGATLIGANLQGASLELAQLEGAVLADAHLQGARLLFANLRAAFLAKAQLQGASLHRAKLQGANLLSADFQGADLEGADLQGADLNLARFKNASADTETTWPAGFDPGHAGVVLIDRPGPEQARSE